MTVAVLGNRHALHSTDNGDTFTALPKGKRATVVHFEDGDPLADRFKIVTDPRGVWAAHAVGLSGSHVTADGKTVQREPIHPEAVPAWVASDSQAVALLLSEHYSDLSGKKVPVRKLKDPYEGRFPHAAQALGLPLSVIGLGLLVVRLSPFLKTNAGNDVQAAQMAGAASATAVLKWVGLTANTTAPAAGDTTLTAEITTASGGLIRKAGTYAHTTAAASYTITTVFTVNGSDVIPVTIGKRGIFDAVTAGNMGFETLVSPTATLSAVGDQLTLTDTITL